MQDDRKAHQITLQELGIIPKEPKRKEEVRKQYAFARRLRRHMKIINRRKAHQ